MGNSVWVQKTVGTDERFRLGTENGKEQMGVSNWEQKTGKKRWEFQRGSRILEGTGGDILTGNRRREGKYMSLRLINEDGKEKVGG